MALTVRDILELPSGQKMELLAGEKGLDRPVVSAEIADYEFAPDLDLGAENVFDINQAMDPGSFVITSFLFAKDDPGIIFSSIRKLQEIGVAALAFKQVIYETLPDEVLAFADQHDFPVLSFGKDVWFENVIFDIMYAVQFDDKVYLSEEKIDAMLSGHMSRSELDIIMKGISLKLRKYVSVVYIEGPSFDAERTLRSFYLLKGFHSKGLFARYGNGVFLILTAAQADQNSHALMQREIFELLGIAKDTSMGMSDVHERKELDRAFRESMQCLMASSVEGETFGHFSETGIYRVLLPALENEESAAFAQDVLEAFADNADLLETAHEYAVSGGDIAKTAASLHCHQNTVRYRLGRIRALTGLQNVTDSELYLQLKVALAIDRAKRSR